MEINPKYKIHLQGYHNKGIDHCLYCNNNMHGELFKYIKGFADTDYGTMAIVECNKCFETFYFHADKIYYDIFLDTIEEGNNIFFNPISLTPEKDNN